MISTVTTTTTTSVVTVTSVASVAVIASLGIAAVITLIGFLVIKELVRTSNRPRLKPMSRFFNVGIVPLIAVFAVIVITKIVVVLQTSG